MEKDLPHDLTRTVLAILIMAGLIAASIWILRPFLAAIVWSCAGCSRACGASGGLPPPS